MRVRMLVGLAVWLCVTAAPAQLREGWIIGGRIYAAFQGQRLALPYTTVTLTDQRFRPLATMSSNPNGDFELMVFPGYTRHLCAEARGFAKTCLPVDPRPGHTPPDQRRLEVDLVPDHDIIWGKVTMADGNPCFVPKDALAPELAATIELLTRGSPESVQATGRANSQGEYVLSTTLPPNSLVRATCGTEQAVRPVLRGPTDLMLSNLPPTIDLLIASDLSGRPIRSATPGETIDVTVQASDPNRDPLTFSWNDEAGIKLSGSGPTLRWTLPSVPARALVAVQVSDGRGGLARKLLTVPLGDQNARFSGTVVNLRGSPLSGAWVSIAGVRTPVDSNGSFFARARPANRYVVVAFATGYAPVSQTFDNGASGIRLTLSESSAFSLGDNRMSTQLADPASRTTLLVPALAFEDAQGNPASVPLTAGLLVYDETKSPPGDGTALHGRVRMLIEIQRALFLDVRDASNALHSLARGKSVRATFTLPQHGSRRPPATLPVARLDAEGQWVIVTDARLLPSSGGGGPTYQTELDALGHFALVEMFSDQTCIRLQAEKSSVVVPLRVEVSRHVAQSGDTPVYQLERELLVGDYDYRAVVLKPNAYYRLAAIPDGLTGAPFDGPPITRYFQTGAANPWGGLLYPYSSCEDRKTLLRRSVPPPPPFLQKGSGMAAETAAYYSAIKANTQKATFTQWKLANGFGSKPEYVARFFNKHELGLGREIVCVLSPLACYIRKYGEPGGPAAHALEDLAHGTNATDVVAIDTLPFPPGIGFYSYSPDGKLKPATQFDAQGPKAMPGVCMGCHGAKAVEGLGTIPAYFVPVDPAAHLYPSGAPSVEDALRIINVSVAFSSNTTPNIRNYIKNNLYKKPDFCNPTVKPCEPPGCSPPPSPPPKECDDPFFVGFAGDVPLSYRDNGTKEAVFVEVIRPFCQTCHMSRPALDWYDVNTLKANASIVRDRVCKMHLMPNALAPYRHIWQGPQAMDLLMDFLGQPRCGPYVPFVVDPKDQLPITAP